MDKLVSNMHKQFDTFMSVVDEANNVFKGFILLSIKQDLEKIDKSDLVAFLIDPSPDVRKLAKEELERREQIRSSERDRKRAWYGKILERIGRKLPVRSGEARKKPKAAREHYRE